MTDLQQNAGVLVCDDEPSDLAAIRSALESDSRFRVLTCSDYTGAIRLFQTHAAVVDIALLDVALPGKNGVDLARDLLAINPRLKVVFVSAHVGKAVLQLYGINPTEGQFLQKPFDSATLLKRVEEALASDQPLEFLTSASGRGGVGF